MDVAEKLCMKNPREREAEVADFEQQTRDLDHHLDLHMRLTRQRTQRKCLRVLLFERENFRLEGLWQACVCMLRVTRILPASPWRRRP